MRYTYLSDGTKAVKPSEDTQPGLDFPFVPIVPRVQDNNYRFAGKEEYIFGNGDSSLLDFGARYYDPWSCQWTAVDPLAEKYCGMSPYNYCIGDPIMFADPDGASPKDKRFAIGIGILTNIVPNSGFLRDAYVPDDRADYNETLQKVDKTFIVTGSSLVAKGMTDISAGATVTVTGVALAATGTGAPVGVGVAVTGGAIDATGLAEISGGAAMAMNAAGNAGKGYDRGKDGKHNSSDRKFIGSGKNEPHGNMAAKEKMDKRNESLKQQLIGATKKERELLKRKIRNNERIGDKNAKGETHHR